MRKVKKCLIPVCAAILYMLLATLKLDNSVWFDESYSAYLTRGSFSEIWNLTAVDVHPPLYYFLLKIWSGIFGYTDISMRFMSIFFGALGIILLFFLLRRKFGEKVAGGAALMVALSPVLIRYGQEMRMYTLVFFLVVAGTYALELALEKDEWKYYIIYAVILALGMWTHYFTALAWIAHIVYYKFCRRRGIFEKKMFWTYVLAVGMYLPWLPKFIEQTGTVQNGFWIPEISALTPVNYLTQAVFFADAEKVNNWLVVLLLSVVIFTTVLGKKIYRGMRKEKKTALNSLLFLIIVPPVVLLILSLPPLKPMFIDRYTIYSAALIWAVLGVIIMTGLEEERGKVMKVSHGPKKWRVEMHLSAVMPIIVTAALLLVSAKVGIENVVNREPEGSVKEIVMDVKAISEEGEPIVAGNEWIYYDGTFYSDEERPVMGVDEWIDYRYGSLEPIRTLRYNLIEDFDKFLEENERFWYIVETKDGNGSGVDTGEEKEDEIVLPAKNLRVVNEIMLENHMALELEKTH